MPVRQLLDTSEIDLQATLFDRVQLEEWILQRGQAVQLDRIVWVDPLYEDTIATRRIRDDEWWCDGHIPGRPILPAVMMVECAAQLASFIYQIRANRRVGISGKQFVAFTGIENTRFRGMLSPGDDLLLMCHTTRYDFRRLVCDIQGWKGPQLVFETRVMGMPMAWTPDGGIAKGPRAIAADGNDESSDRDLTTANVGS